MGRQEEREKKINRWGKKKNQRSSDTGLDDQTRHNFGFFVLT